MTIACSVANVNAESLSCAGVPVTVRAPDPAIAERTCRAAERVLPLIAECGVVLAASREIDIEVVEDIPEAPDCLGVYHCGANRIEVLGPGAIETLRRKDSAFSSIPTAIYFDSIVAHELAHSAYDVMPCAFSDCLVTAEYIAYAMQVFSLPPPDREAFEADFDLNDKVSRYEISAISLHLAPERFARNVWAHFSQREDGCAYVADMMKANFYLDTERP